ncbi:hypothetical protein SB6412_02617 [Klebsiella pasteurii]|uniref:hypothetical protein n=1 Tax=Klebsiella TaxID=570 RepID=UPI00115BEBD2|nr:MULTISPECIES: hypothetical protein [Klebsiella]MEB6368992.1 hypothetical protein [Klebsiella michiganensis]UXO80935.1 hypothetical protein N7918_11470 [Klebsiella michiganensis]VUS54180.1 hypothetical protein SB6412_02617 [Klebsiella pasteurii]
MKKKAALITIHGMGKTDPTYADAFFKKINKKLGSRSENLHTDKIYYQKILQDNEDLVWGRVMKNVRWLDLRQFILFGFGDAAGLEAKKDSTKSVYTKAQAEIGKVILNTFDQIEPGAPVFIIAQSLGCQVASCYFWDAQEYLKENTVTAGIWKSKKDLEFHINNNMELESEKIKFLAGNRFNYFYTTGCNIPIFVAAHATEEILPIKPNSSFVWKNYYDKDDVLGWPLENLSDEYGSVVKDYPINAGDGPFGWIGKSWNPMSHTQYWEDDDVLEPLVENIKKYLP